MSLSLPEPILNYLHDDLGEFLKSASDLNRLREQARKLSTDFTRNKFSESLNERAYFAFNFPVNFMKTNVIARSLIGYYHHSAAQATEFNILDLGCGEGAGLLGFYYALCHQWKISLTGVDKSARMIFRFQRIIEKIKKPSQSFNFQPIRADAAKYISNFKQKKYNIIILANSILEIFPQRIGLSFIKKLISLLGEKGFIIIIEPALKKSFQRLDELRTQFIAKLNAHIMMPCMHEQECPLAVIPGEWCHQSIPWQPPEYLETLNKGLNREINILKFSLLVVTKEKIKHINGYRVISSLLKEKGKTKCYLCSPASRIELVRLDRERSDMNRAFDTINKGAIIELVSPIEQNLTHWKVNARTKIKIIDAISI